MKKVYLAVLATLVMCAAVMFGAMTVFGAPSSGKLTADDYAAIEQLYARYNHTIDSGDSEGWVATFTPDGRFGKKPYTGETELAQFAHEWKTDGRGARTRHFNSNLSITPTAEGAKGAVYLMSVNILVSPPVVQSVGWYDDVLVKTREGWRFKSRAVRSFETPSVTQQ